MIYPYDYWIEDHGGDLEHLYQNILSNVYFKINYYRRIHGVKELVIDKDLAEAANTTAKNVIKYHDYIHSSKYNNSEVSENFCKFTSFELVSQKEPNVPSTLGVNDWYNEIKKFDYNNPEIRAGTDEFTAMVWKNSTKIGCGVDRENWISGHKYYMVCMFWPSGNIQGYFNSEVLKPLYDEPQENLYIKNK